MTVNVCNFICWFCTLHLLRLSSCLFYFLLPTLPPRAAFSLHPSVSLLFYTLHLFPLSAHNFNAIVHLQDHFCSIPLLLLLFLLLHLSCLLSLCVGCVGVGGKKKHCFPPHKEAPPEWKLPAEINNDIRQ